jgi:hypothetical protein
MASMAANQNAALDFMRCFIMADAGVKWFQLSGRRVKIYAGAA